MSGVSRSSRSMRQGKLLRTISGAGGRISRDFDGEIFTGRVRLAEQGVTVALFVLHQSQRAAVRITHFAVTNARATRRAMPALAAVRKIQAGAKGRVENGLTAFHGEDLLRWQQRDAVRRARQTWPSALASSPPIALSALQPAARANLREVGFAAHGERERVVQRFHRALAFAQLFHEVGEQLIRFQARADRDAGFEEAARLAVQLGSSRELGARKQQNGVIAVFRQPALRRDPASSAVLRFPTRRRRAPADFVPLFVDAIAQR